MSRCAPAVVLFGVVTAACGGSARDVAFATALDQKLAPRFPAGEPGGAVLVMKRDRIVFERGYGLADLGTHAAATPQTLFNLGSISKTFVANAILILRDAGKLSLDDDLTRYFAFKNPALAARVKLRHLLTHTSGLPDTRNVRGDPTFYLTAKDEENWHPITQADALEFEPGSRFEYSNPAFNGLALIVEKLCGMKWQAFVRERIFLPAGMATSTITDGPHPQSGVAHGYDKEGDRFEEADYGEVPTFAAAGNGGVWSSVEELARYEQALGRGTFLAPATLAESRTVKTFDNWSSKDPPEVGWSWFIGHGEPRQVGHTGSQGGFLATYNVLPEKGVFFVILLNTPRDIKAMTADVLAQLEGAGWLD